MEYEEYLNNIFIKCFKDELIEYFIDNNIDVTFADDIYKSIYKQLLKHNINNITDANLFIKDGKIKGYIKDGLNGVSVLVSKYIRSSKIRYRITVRFFRFYA